MRYTAERQIGHTLDRVNNGHITAHRALSEIFDSAPVLGIGTAQSAEYHLPTVLLTDFGNTDDPTQPIRWRFSVGNEEGAQTFVRAGRVVSTALWFAFGGDANIVRQRQSMEHVRPILPENKFYHGGTHGAYYDLQAGTYTPIAHQDLIRAADPLPDDLIIGKADLVWDDESFTMQIPDEPGHVASPNIHHTIGSMSIRIGDVRPLFSRVRPYYYEPLTR